MKVIQHIELSSPQSSLTFSSIPQTFTDLMLVTSLRSDSNGMNQLILRFNSSTSGYSLRRLRGTGSAADSYTESAQTGYNGYGHVANPSENTANTFSNNSFYIPNYRASQNKSFSIDSVVENNGTAATSYIVAALWADTSAITSLVVSTGNGNFVTGSSATLYGILAGSDGITTVS